jgi:hypothetical protein
MQPMTSRPAAATKPEFRTRVGNGKALLLGVDQRTNGARRHREIVEAIERDLGPDLTEIERLRVMNCACWQLHAEELTARMVRGEAVDPEAVTRAVNGAARALAALQRGKAARKPARSAFEALEEHLARKRAEAAG